MTTTTTYTKATATYLNAEKQLPGYPTNIVVGKNPTFTWQQVAQHNTEQSAWVSNQKKVYDITDWLNRHPGGKHILLLSAGRDITDLLVSYHPFTNKPAEILEKYYIGDLITSEFPIYRPDSGFYRECREEVGKYFQQTKKHVRSPVRGSINLAFFLFFAFSSYYIIANATLPAIFRILAAVIFGVCQALPLLHVMHDASHFAIGSNQKSWIFFGYFTMDYFAGASINSWYNQHILGHHVYTNVHDLDPDIPYLATTDIRRVSKHQRKQWFYAYQTYYLCVLYGVLAIKFRIQDITNTMYMKSNGAIRVNTLYNTDTPLQIVSKLFWATWRFVIPLFYFQVEAQSFLLLNLLAEFVTGYYLTFNFQVSHVNPDCEFFTANRNDSILSEEWAVSQLESSLDYGHASAVATFLCGALNYQSIHHLFPSISQYHYPAIAPIVSRVAKKHKVRYNYVPTFLEAIKLHLRQLTEMGAEHLHHY